MPTVNSRAALAAVLCIVLSACGGGSTLPISKRPLQSAHRHIAAVSGCSPQQITFSDYFDNGVDQGPGAGPMFSVTDTTQSTTSNQIDYSLTITGNGSFTYGSYTLATITTYVYDSSGHSANSSGYVSPAAEIPVGGTSTVPVIVSGLNPCQVYAVQINVSEQQTGSATTAQMASIYYADAPKIYPTSCNAPQGYVCTLSGSGTVSTVPVSVEYPTLSTTSTPIPNRTDPPTCRYSRCL